MIRKIGLIAIVGVAVIGFQNCGKASHSGAVDSATDASSAGNNTITDSSGRQLTFLNFKDEKIGDANAVSVSGNVMQVQLIHPLAGRRATIKVYLDPVSKRFVSVERVGKPFMCFDPAQDYCAQVVIPAGYSGAGGLGLNCSSPIKFVGALKGSVDNIESTADLIYCNK